MSYQSSEVFAQLAERHELFGGWDESQVLATAIQEQNPDAIDAIYFHLPPRAQQIIDRLIAIAWNVPVSSLSVIDEEY